MENPKGTVANASYAAYAAAATIFICPSDPNTGAIVSENNYRYNFGGSTPYAGWVTSGSTTKSSNAAFTIGKVLFAAKDFTDGLSKTVFFAERTKGSLNAAGSQPPTMTTWPAIYALSWTQEADNDARRIDLQRQPQVD